MITQTWKTGETIITDDDGFRYRVFIDPEIGPQMVYEEYSTEKEDYIQKDRIGLPSLESVEAMISALQHVQEIMIKERKK